MARDPHAAAVRVARRTTRELGRLFNRLGTRQAPRGRVLVAYRVARRALAGKLTDPVALIDVLDELRRSVEAAVREVLNDAAALGADQARRELEIYGVRPGIAGGAEDALVEGGLAAVMAVLMAQANAIRTMSLTGMADEGQILGDTNRVGLLSPAPVIREAARWVTGVAFLAWSRQVQGPARASGLVFRRQAVAAIDERTTETCLRVHGQVVPLDGKFKLTGTPRYADELERPPFHWYCRTATVLVLEEHVQDKLTQEMRDAARAELLARQRTGRRVEIHPAHARSRR